MESRCLAGWKINWQANFKCQLSLLHSFLHKYPWEKYVQHFVCPTEGNNLKLRIKKEKKDLSEKIQTLVYYLEDIYGD